MDHLQTAAFFCVAVTLVFAWGGQSASPAYRVHLVTHSHDDVGWLKTPAQYFYGWNNSIQHANVKLIYDSVVASLIAHPNEGRCFTVVEIAFFSKWYYRQTPQLRSTVKELVSNGVIEFATGGWVSHDEATATYLDMLDQVSLGLQFLYREFGASAQPRTHWQVDPFGHTAGHVMLFGNEAGNMESLFFSRMDYRDFSKRQQLQEREFLWIPSASLGAKSFTFTSMMLHGSYCPPLDFNFDILLSEPNVVSDVCTGWEGEFTVSECTDATNTLKHWANKLGSMLQSDALLTRGPDIMWTMGCDFTHMQAETWFQNMERMQKVVEAAANITATGPLWASSWLYSTPHRYTQLKLEGGGLFGSYVLPTKLSGDFVPYADGPHAYWTGFYASRPSLKRFIRQASSWYRGFRQLVAAADGFHFDDAVRSVAEAMGEMQHHDAVTGTAKQHVTNNYAKTLFDAIHNATVIISDSLAAAAGGLTVTLDACLTALNTSTCTPITDAVLASRPFYVLGWNSNGNSNTDPNVIRWELPLPSPATEYAWNVFPESASIEVHVMRGVCVDDYFPAHRCRADSGMVTMIAWIEVSHVNPGQPFVVVAAPSPQQVFRSDDDSFVPMNSVDDETIERESVMTVVETAALQLQFNATTGVLTQIWNKSSNITMVVSMSFCTFAASTGDAFSTQSAGAYIFRPTNAPCARVESPSDLGQLEVVYISASHVVVEQNITEWLSVRWMVSGDRLDVDYTVRELPLSPDGEGRELMMWWSTDMTNGGDTTLWSDTNGLELIQRNATELVDEGEPVASAIFPVTSAIVLRDLEKEWMVLVDRSTGCLSLQRGSIGCIVHRRLSVDDNRGVGEPLNETEDVTPYVNCEYESCGRHHGRPMSVRGRWGLSLGVPSSHRWRALSERRRNSDSPFFVGAGAPSPMLVSSWLGLGKAVPWNVGSLPPRVQLVSLERLSCEDYSQWCGVKAYWVRLAHIDACTSYASCVAKAALVDMVTFFPTCTSVLRSTLTSPAALWRERNHSDALYVAFNRSLRQSGDTSANLLDRPVGFLNTSSRSVVLYPMEIHALVVIVR